MNYQSEENDTSFRDFIPCFLYAQTSVYDIHYNTVIGDGSCSSSLSEQKVTTGGIIIAADYLSGQYFISSSQGGAWNGIFIYDNNNTPSISDSTLITGTVAEYQGCTEMKDLTFFQVISSSNALTNAVKISTDDVTSEAYEGVLVEVNRIHVSAVFDALENWWVDDGSGVCEISTGFFKLKERGFLVIENSMFSKIIGIIGVNSGNKKLNPRSIESNSDTELPVEISILNPSETIHSYSLKVQYDPLIFQYLGFDKTATISESGTITDASTEGNIELNYTGSTNCDILSRLIKLNFKPLATGSASLQFAGTEINESNLSYSLIGSLEYTDNTTSLEDLKFKVILQNFPNPFSTKTNINFNLKKQANVNISIYNMSGQLVKVLINDLKIPGEYSVKWDATNEAGSKVENGIYIYKYLVEGNLIDSRQMIYIKP